MASSTRRVSSCVSLDTSCSTFFPAKPASASAHLDLKCKPLKGPTLFCAIPLGRVELHVWYLYPDPFDLHFPTRWLSPNCTPHCIESAWVLRAGATLFGQTVVSTTSSISFLHAPIGVSPFKFGTLFLSGFGRPGMICIDAAWPSWQTPPPFPSAGTPSRDGFKPASSDPM